MVEALMNVALIFYEPEARITIGLYLRRTLVRLVFLFRLPATRLKKTSKRSCKPTVIFVRQKMCFAAAESVGFYAHFVKKIKAERFFWRKL
jgi:hypothetical protein